MEVVADRHVGQSQEWLVACRSTSRVRLDDTQSHSFPDAQLWVGSSGNWSVFIAMGYHEKAPFRGPCCQLAVLHDVQRTLKPLPRTIEWKSIRMNVTRVSFWYHRMSQQHPTLPLHILRTTYI